MQSLILPLFRLIMAPVVIAAGTFAIGLPPQGATTPMPRSAGSARTQENNVPVQNDGSLNWAGYVAQATSTNYTGVSGSWIVPDVSDPQSGTADATWIGVGGVTGQDLIQAGTQALINHGGDITYEAWYETLPDYSTEVPMAVKPGDEIHASIVLQSPDEWLVSIADETTGEHYSATVPYHSSQSSAEWIEEMVSNGDYTFRPLDDFGEVNFESGTAIINGQAKTIAESGAKPLEMLNDSGDLLASVSNLGTNGSSFTVARTDAAAVTEPVSTVEVYYTTVPLNEEQWRHHGRHFHFGF